MTPPPKQLERRWLRAPREDRTALIEPPLEQAGELVERNIQLRQTYDYDVQGRSLGDLARQARRELIEAAQRWTSAYRDVEASAAAPGRPIFLAGHQPQLFHPGVWLKNFALDALARQHGAAAVNLIVDSDAVKGTSLAVPGGSIARPQRAMIPLDRPEPEVPYEERRIADRQMFEGFGSRVAEHIRPLVPDPLVTQYWPLVLQRARRTDNLGACLAQARHQLEGLWRSETLEVPQSLVCDTESFRWLVAHLLAQLPRHRETYNEAVEEYRRVHQIRGAAQPVPDLAAEGQWLEAPLWVWTADDPQRRRLFAAQRAGEIELSDQQSFTARLPLDADADAGRAVERLSEIAAAGVRIRSRALITTLWARLALGDLFLHGIGGAKYDQVTDLLIERFFGLMPPGFIILSATLQLPIAHRHVTADDARAIQQRLRELTYHPERVLREMDGRRPSAPGDPAELISAKLRWLQTPQTPGNARARCRAIRQINESLQSWVAPERERLLRLQAETAEALRATKILAWREYGFCLYPADTLQEFLAALLPKTA